MPEQNNTASGTRRRRQQPVDNTFAHVQPQATEIERAVLGALMIDKDALRVSTNRVTKRSIRPFANCRCTSCLSTYGL